MIKHILSNNFLKCYFVFLINIQDLSGFLWAFLFILRFGCSSPNSVPLPLFPWSPCPDPPGHSHSQHSLAHFHINHPSLHLSLKPSFFFSPLTGPSLFPGLCLYSFMHSHIQKLKAKGLKRCLSS